MLQETNQLGRFNASGIKPKVKIPNREASNSREALPIEGVLQHRSLASRGPSAYPMRPLAQAAFVHEHYRSPLLAGFFLISGQRSRFHRLMAASSRWMARPVGRWQLQPSERKMRQTWPRWNFKPV